LFIKYLTHSNLRSVPNVCQSTRLSVLSLSVLLAPELSSNLPNLKSR